MTKNKSFTRRPNLTPSEDAVTASISLAKAILEENRQFGTQRPFAAFAERILSGFPAMGRHTASPASGGSGD